MVAGLLRPDRGHIRIGDRTLFGEGVDLPPEARRIGYVFQDGRLFPHRRVCANLFYGHAPAAPDARLVGLVRIRRASARDRQWEVWQGSGGWYAKQNKKQQ